MRARQSGCMSTERRIRASQQNGARSRSPKTAKEKRGSSVNPIRHGILSPTVVLDDEDDIAPRHIPTALRDEFRPHRPKEYALVNADRCDTLYDCQYTRALNLLLQRRENKKRRNEPKTVSGHFATERRQVIAERCANQPDVHGTCTL